MSHDFNETSAPDHGWRSREEDDRIVNPLRGSPNDADDAHRDSGGSRRPRPEPDHGGDAHRALPHKRAAPFHLKRALENGVKDGLSGVITHLAFHAGWPPANTAGVIARQIAADAAGGAK